jgi:hypothetical protein
MAIRIFLLSLSVDQFWVHYTSFSEHLEGLLGLSNLFCTGISNFTHINYKPEGYPMGAFQQRTKALLTIDSRDIVTIETFGSWSPGEHEVTSPPKTGLEGE